MATSGSVALLADTIHNVGDSLDSVPLLIAFYLARRAATRRYTYGFGRAEDHGHRLVEEVRQTLLTHIRHLAPVTVETLSAADPARAALSILPPRYQDPNTAVSAAPMGAAALKYDAAGTVAWDEMWTGYCELALAGGAPHRGRLREPGAADAIAADPERYEWVPREIERGLRLVTGLPVRRSEVPGWIGLECEGEKMALWLLRAIVVENVSVRREGTVLWCPGGQVRPIRLRIAPMTICRCQ